MKLIIALLIIILNFNITLKGQEKYPVNWTYEGLTFNEFVIKIEDRYELKFLYKDEWVIELELGKYDGCTTLTCILDNLFINSPLNYYIDDSENVVITKDLALTGTNEYAYKSSTLGSEIVPGAHSEGRQLSENAFIELGNR
jgi:hypothetical protein